MRDVQQEISVSESIGVILLLAVTVILAAIIASMAFGTIGSLNKPKIIAITVEQSDSDILVKYMGGTDAPHLTYLEITAPNSSIFKTISQNGELNPDGTPQKPDVGSIMTLSGASTNKKDHVIVVGHFSDGAIQVLLDIFV